MKHLVLICLLFLGLNSQTFAQNEDKPEFDPQLAVYEDSLANIATQIIEGETEYDRAKACFAFIPELVKTLKIPGSFHYPFEKLQTISILKPDDNSFRIFSWVLRKNNKTYRFYGAIQMNTEDSKLKLFPLYDYSDSIQNPLDTILNNESWYGALYYKVLEVKHRRNTYYTLLGWDGNDAMSTKKVADVLYFEDEKPVFGAPIFEIMEEDAEETTIKNRIIVEYKVNSNVTLNYYPPEDMIIHDHVIAPDDKSKGLQFTYVPDGTYVGYKWKKGQWNYVERVFNKNIDKPDDPPVPHPSKEKGLSAPDK